jgi:hypothetical protein
MVIAVFEASLSESSNGAPPTIKKKSKSNVTGSSKSDTDIIRLENG